MIIVTWNINSVRIREPLIARFLTLHQPDVLCLQETKCEDQHFPHELIQSFLDSPVSNPDDSVDQLNARRRFGVRDTET